MINVRQLGIRRLRLILLGQISSNKKQKDNQEKKIITPQMMFKGVGFNFETFFHNHFMYL
jgi:hypothetical protein